MLTLAQVQGMASLDGSALLCPQGQGQGVLWPPLLTWSLPLQGVDSSVVPLGVSALTAELHRAAQSNPKATLVTTDRNS